ncbi:MAG: phosphoribosylformylglycinamidine cyclo-ligase [Saprospiraceae bacterium]|nr:phosphoribosylformylglycinamidine cyclo-ligase [Saprospiraceae bacterium]
MAKRYESLGVSASKSEVEKAIRSLDKGLVENAFCKVLPDTMGGDPLYCNLMHADTAGTKTNLAYLWWKETADLSVWKNIAQDALVMNLDDLACTGASSPVTVSSTIGRNKHLIPGEIIEAIIQGTEELLRMYRDFGIEILSGGGETADVGDIVRTIDVGITAFCRLPLKDILPIDIKPGDLVIGLASYGQAVYEKEYNSGIGSNGLTAARHDLLSKYYLEHFPETVAPQTNPAHAYTGPFRITDQSDSGHIIGRLLCSPTRTYVPFLHELIHHRQIRPHGIIHLTGGAHTKVKKFIRNLKIIKDQLIPAPPVFSLIARHSLCSPDELYEVYNMGQRLEIYCIPEDANQILKTAKDFGIEASVIGRVESSKDTTVELHTAQGIFQY